MPFLACVVCVWCVYGVFGHKQARPATICYSSTNRQDAFIQRHFSLHFFLHLISAHLSPIALGLPPSGWLLPSAHCWPDRHAALDDDDDDSPRRLTRKRKTFSDLGMSPYRRTTEFTLSTLPSFSRPS
uniref:Putative secreted protein n=1 Tax=Anopheles marajoara TaxID=58244 RepID=A0A2M4C703_9DIPT